MSRGFTRKELCITLCVLVFAPCVLGILMPLDPLFTLLIGWIFYLDRIANEMTVDWAAVASAIVVLLLFAIGIHKFCGWFYKNSPEPTNGQRQWKFAWTSAIVGSVVLMFCAGTAMIGVTHQVSWLFTSETPMFRWIATGREPPLRTHTRNNLKQIGLANHDYHDQYQELPAGATFDKTGRPLHSWVTRLLPYLDTRKVNGQELTSLIRHDVPWNDPLNRHPFQQSLSVVQNLGMPRRDEPTDFNAEKYALAHYAANVLVIGPQRPLRLKDITDGTLNTFMAGEVNAKFRPWGDPFNFRDAELGINKSPDGFGGPFEGGAFFLCADGSVQFISEDVDFDWLKATATPDGGEERTIPGGLIE